MAEHKPPTPDRKLALVAPLSIAAVAAAIIVAAVVLRPAAPPPAPAPVAPPPSPVAAAPPLPPPVVGRAELIEDVNAIAAAYAAGQSAPAGKDPLIGRRFRIRTPFGCQGPQASGGGAQAYAAYDPETRALRLVAQPVDWTSLPQIQGQPDRAKIEAAEGFWVPRPWMLTETCPPKRNDALPATQTPPASQTLGLVQLFAAGASRVGRHADQPYESVQKIAPDEVDRLSQSYRLVLEGRITGFADGKAASCWSESADHRPVCLFAVSLDHVAFESEGGKVLAHWEDAG